MALPCLGSSHVPKSAGHGQPARGKLWDPDQERQEAAVGSSGICLQIRICITGPPSCCVGPEPRPGASKLMGPGFLLP